MMLFLRNNLTVVEPVWVTGLAEGPSVLSLLDPPVVEHFLRTRKDGTCACACACVCVCVCTCVRVRVCVCRAHACLRSLSAFAAFAFTTRHVPSALLRHVPLFLATPTDKSELLPKSIPLVRMIATAEPTGAGGLFGSRLGPMQAKRSLLLVNGGKLGVHVSALGWTNGDLAHACSTWFLVWLQPLCENGDGKVHFRGYTWCLTWRGGGGLYGACTG